MISKLWRPRLALTSLLLLPTAACSTTAENQDDPLAGGEADWERPPLDPPGGDGDAPPDTGGDDSGGASTGGSGTATGGDSDGGGTSGFTSGGSTGGTTGGGPYTCEPGDSTGGGTAGETGTGTTGDPGTSGSTGTAGGTGGTVSCDAEVGICEAAYDTSEAPCCEDADCACDTSDCSSNACQADGFCDCKCAADPDCAVDECGQPVKAPPPGDIAAECPADPKPVVLYMSNDDSNSMASPAFARRTINEGMIVDPFRIRIHEFLNYYDMSYENPDNEPATVGLQMRRVSGDSPEFVLLAYAQGREMTNQERRPMNLVLSIDTSGSMSGEPIQLLKDSVLAIAGSLKEGDVVSVVEWAETQSVHLEGHEITGPNDPVLLDVANSIEAGGGTDLHGGLVRAYQLANNQYSKDRINRVVILSDGGANVGITDIDLISAEARDEDEEGIYLVGVGVSEAAGYHDTLMDDMTDAGKGAYVFVDSAAEAQKIFGERFVQTMEVAARNVRLELTMPWYFGIKEFHGEEYSEDPEEVEPQHLSPSDAMSYHQIISACDDSVILGSDKVKAKVEFQHPITREAMSDEVELSIHQLTNSMGAEQLYKGDVIVAFAQALIVTGDLHKGGQKDEAVAIAQAMVGWLGAAENALGDPEITEMKQLMGTYVTVLQNN